MSGVRFIKKNQIVGNRYQIIKPIGKGGMSDVYLVNDLKIHKEWALKVVDSMKRGYDAKNEQKILKSLSHPALPCLSDLFFDGGLCYFVMEYIPGKTIGEILSERRMELDEVIEITKALCDVLSYLHHRTPPIIFRDMKPDNVMITEDGNVKLIDFGIARNYCVNQKDDTVCLGTKGYAAPEQFGGIGQSDERTDVYGLGVTFYHMLTGHNPNEKPYGIQSIRDWNRNLPEVLNQIIHRCTNQNPDKRYATCDELHRDLVEYQKRDRRYQWKNVIKISGFFILMLVAIICILCGIWMKQQEKIKKETICETLVMEEKWEQVFSMVPERCDLYIAYLDSRIEQKKVISYKELLFLERFLLENGNLLKNSKDYGKLCAEIGLRITYWYDGNEKERMIMSYPWIAKACQNKGDLGGYDIRVLKAYESVGYYYKEINPMLQKGYFHLSGIKTFWNQLESLLVILSSGESCDSNFRAQVCLLVTESIHNDYTYFVNAGISSLKLHTAFQTAWKQKKKIQVNQLPEQMKEKVFSILGERNMKKWWEVMK